MIFLGSSMPLLEFCATDLLDLFRLLGQISSHPTHHLHTAAQMVAKQYLAYLDRKVANGASQEKPGFFKDMLLNFSRDFDPKILENIHEDLEGEQLQHNSILCEEERDDFLECLRTAYEDNKKAPASSYIPQNMQAHLSIMEIKVINLPENYAAYSAYKIENEKIKQDFFSDELEKVKAAIISIFRQSDLYFPFMLEHNGFARIRALIHDNHFSAPVVDNDFVSYLIFLICADNVDDKIKTELVHLLFYAYIFTKSTPNDLGESFHEEKNLRLLSDFFYNCTHMSQLTLVFDLLMRIARDTNSLDILIRSHMLEKLYDLLMNMELPTNWSIYIVYVVSKIFNEYRGNHCLDRYNPAAFYLEGLKLWKNKATLIPRTERTLEIALENFQCCAPPIFSHDERIILFAIDNLQHAPNITLLLDILCMALDYVLHTNNTATISIRSLLLKHSEKIFTVAKALIYADRRNLNLIFLLIQQLLKLNPVNKEHFFNLNIDADINEFLFDPDHLVVSSVLAIIFLYAESPAGKERIFRTTWKYIHKLKELSQTSNEAEMKISTLVLCQELQIYIQEFHKKKLSLADTLRQKSKFGQAKNIYAEIIKGELCNTREMNCAAYYGLGFCHHATFLYFCSIPKKCNDSLFNIENTQKHYQASLRYYRLALNLSNDRGLEIESQIYELKQAYNIYCAQSSAIMISPQL